MNLGAFVRAITSPYVRHLVRRHVATVSGLEHLPSKGAFVLVPNHSSYFDHFAVEMIIRTVRRTPTWFLTKRESFEKPLPRAWARAWYGIPVDRDSPSPDTLREVRRVLSAGDVMCIYPEGTRGVGPELLPFKPGAFRFALANGVPVIPVGIFGSSSVLAKDDRWFRRNGRMHMAFGPALPTPTCNGATAKAEAISTTARDAIESLVLRAAAQARSRATRGGGESDELDRIITGTLGPDATLAPEDASRLRALARSMTSRNRSSSGLKAQRLRIDGLAAAHSKKPLFLLKAFAIRALAERIIRHSPREATAQYILGRWHLSMPNKLGGDPWKSLDHFQIANDAAKPGDTRALSGLADAYLRTGQTPRAIAMLMMALAKLNDDDPRAELRRQRTVAKIASISDPAKGNP